MSSKKRNKSYFLPYLSYKMRNNFVQIIIFAIMNFIILISTILFNSATFFELSRHIPQNSSDRYNIDILNDLEFKIIQTSSVTMLLSLILLTIGVIMFVIISARSFSYYHNRAMMDMLGCLPLSYSERFWGDYLCGLLTNMISFIPLGTISLFMTLPLNLISNDLQGHMSGMIADFPGMIRNFVISVFLIYMAVHAITVFITSCSGKFGDSIIFSFMAMLIMPGLFTGFGMTGFSDLKGIDMVSEVSELVKKFPPFGNLFSAIIASSNGFGVLIELINNLMLSTAFNNIMSILIIAAFIVGAYFIGRHRRADRVEQSFVFSGAYHALSLTLTAMVIGMTVFYSLEEEFDKTVFFRTLGISFVFYMALELSRNKSFKGFWKSLLRYAGVFGASFGFLILMRSTDGFGIQNRIPSVNSISKVEVSGDYFYSPRYGNDDDMINVFSDRNAISSIIDEHRKLLDNADRIYTGNMLKITYVKNNGHRISRIYSCDRNDDIIEEFSKNVRQLDAEKTVSLGFLDNPVYEGIEAHYYDRISTARIIRPDKNKQFIDILKNDILKKFEKGYNSYIGSVRFDNTIDDISYDIYYIMPTYTDTLEFLNDPDNFMNNDEIKETVKVYKIDYMSGTQADFRVDLKINISSDDESEKVKRFIGLVELRNNNDEYSELFYIYGDDYNSMYAVKKENENEARALLVEIFREKNAG